jgi:hypothetical protein
MLKLKHGNESYAGILPRLPPVIFLREHGRNLRSVDSKSTTASFPARRSALPGSVVYVSTAQADSGPVT